MPDSLTPDSLTPGRLMLVHAHPDDESSTNGGTMASYAAVGAQVTLVTCTLGESGEVVTEELAHLAEEGKLGAHRLGELTESMAILGITDFVRLGGDHRFRDSGMAYDETGGVIEAAEISPDSLWRTDLLTAADELVTLIRDRRPHVLITYNEFGGYGHPDHIQAHRITMYAAQLAGARAYRPDTQAWSVDRILWNAWPESAFRDLLRATREAGDDESFGGMDPEGELPAMITPNALIDCLVDGRRFAEVTKQALAAHATQVDVTTGFFAQLTASPHWGLEHYVLAAGTPFPATAQAGVVATDVFVGLELG